MQGYKPPRQRNLYKPGRTKNFCLSRSKLEMFIECPRCFYLDRVVGISRPPGYPFSLNNAVDTLLKKEFDLYRNLEIPHPIFKEYGLNFIPFKHENLNQWRNTFKGIKILHKQTNLYITGAVDDLWLDKDNQEIIIVDYKATAGIKPIIELDKEWQEKYKRQVEIYNWLLKNHLQEFKVSNKAYFVYCTADTNRSNFDKHLIFEINLIPHLCDIKWVEKCIFDSYKCLNRKTMPNPAPNCHFCKYRKAIYEYTIKSKHKK